MAGLQHPERLLEAGPRAGRKRGEADRLRQMVANLVENGVRYSPPGGRVSVGVQADGEDWASVEVVDNGIGIAAEHLPRIFDRFYRVDPARGRSTGGTGLGLAIVKHVAETHGGGVAVTSTPGEGSRFVVRLPSRLPAGAPLPDDAADDPIMDGQAV